MLLSEKIVVLRVLFFLFFWEQKWLYSKFPSPVDPPHFSRLSDGFSVWQTDKQKKKRALMPHLNGKVIASKLEFELVLSISCSRRLLKRNIDREHVLRASVFLPIPSYFHSVHFCTECLHELFYVLSRLFWCRTDRVDCWFSLKNAVETCIRLLSRVIW